VNLEFKQLADGEWQCLDNDTFDGAPDAARINRLVGIGRTKSEAATDWFDSYMDEFAAVMWKQIVKEYL
jgi:hypothetical protein